MAGTLERVARHWKGRRRNHRWGPRKPASRIGIAVMPSLSRTGEVDAWVEGYGQVIAEERHDVGSVSSDTILKKVTE